MEELIEIYICAGAGEPMVRVPEVEAIPGRGLAGDRYANGIGTWSRKPEWWNEVTLIESETLEMLEREQSLRLGQGAHRRNLVTRGIALQELIGREFVIGDVRLLGLRPCDPCRYLDEQTTPGARHQLKQGRGGLRAGILQGGALRAGAEIRTARKSAIAETA
jgi:MOSC domain-containing protein YiiM